MGIEAASKLGSGQVAQLLKSSFRTLCPADFEVLALQYLRESCEIGALRSFNHAQLVMVGRQRLLCFRPLPKSVSAVPFAELTPGLHIPLQISNWPEASAVVAAGRTLTMSPSRHRPRWEPEGTATTPIAWRKAGSATALDRCHLYWADKLLAIKDGHLGPAVNAKAPEGKGSLFSLVGVNALAAVDALTIPYLNYLGLTDQLAVPGTGPKIFFTEDNNHWRPSMMASAKALGFEYSSAPVSSSGLELSSFDAVIPVHLGPYNILQEKRDKGEKVPAFFPHPEVVALCEDKRAFNEAMLELGFEKHIPRMFANYPDDPLEYPLILKDKGSAFGENSFIIDRGEHRKPFNSTTHFLQSYIPGPEEWATHILLVNGKVRFTRSVRYTMSAERPYIKGKKAKPSKLTWFDDTPYLSLYEKILASIGFTDGPACFDYKLRGDRCFVFELNARIGGSLKHQMPHYLKAYVDAAMEGKCEIDQKGSPMAGELLFGKSQREAGPS
ncbi:hypothetical protein [Reyranella sp.]|uniref:hypothetical protein n=1 Tax=Reyranella sp. TaxID=1929291 RepID=UPI003D128326